VSYFEHQLDSDETTRELQQLLASIKVWLESNGFQNKPFRQRFEKIEGLLDEKQRNVLFLAEFSRGKSELINSTIFGKTGRRYLPSTPGRTTRCTTVLRYEADELPSIRLLPTLGPAEIQRQPISILTENPAHWERTLFAASDSSGIINALQQITEVQMVTLEVARDLGFIETLNQNELSKIDVIDNKIAIPKYRHAIINFPHPLLKRGLCIVDTPGLNALGIEPELTLRSLESANAIVFVLSADTGITRSELDAWNEHVKQGYTDNVLVVINKIDTLWDELSSQNEINSRIKKQVLEVARSLEIPPSRVFPVSAQKSLVARKTNNHALITASGILKYEQALADTINFTNRKSIVERTRTDITSILTTVQRVLLQRSETAKNQITEIQVRKQNQNKVSDAKIHKVKTERERLKTATQKLDMFRVQMKLDYDEFVTALDIVALDKMIANYRLEISNQLTTPGLQREMNQFQLQAVEKFNNALSYITSLEYKLNQLYRNIEEILDTNGLKPRKVHPEIYLESLRKYSENHARYAKGITMVMTEQNALKDRYHASVMVKIRKLYVQTKDDVELWIKSVLTPVELELKEKEAQLRKRLLSFERVHTQDSDLNDELKVLRSRIESHRQRSNTVAHFISRLDEVANHDDAPDISNVVNLRNHNLSKS
jgi:hypothetical protein